MKILAALLFVFLVGCAPTVSEETIKLMIEQCREKGMATYVQSNGWSSATIRCTSLIINE